ncbi:MAG: hypothetical protein V2I56_03910 [Desulfobacteraceae bacterium]|jgi:hypothetical protein|nr:hypothetical protein [Desulfobacteraceae bacterium]
MEIKIENFFLSCSEIDFGAVNLSDGEKEFCSELNNEVFSLCKSLPESTQTQALLLFMEYFRISFGQEYSFFMNYYAPAWSIIYWLIHSGSESKRLTIEDIENARTAHGMALLLHPLDDHLNDGQLPVTHLTLLLRSQAWMIMNNSMKGLAEKLDGGRQIYQDFIDDYYTGITSSEKIKSLNDYEDLFRKQMATGFVAPVLLSKMTTGDQNFARAIQAIYGSFGIAWRLLDDINDFKTDMLKGSKSAIYTCLPETIRKYWGKDTKDKNSDGNRIILDFILENSIIEKILERMYVELESAAETAEEYYLTGLAAEFRCLASPFKNRQYLL